MVLAGRCLQAAEALKAAVASCRAASAAASGLLASLNGLTGGPGGGGGSGGGGPGSGGAGGVGDEDGALWVIRNLLKVNQGPQGADKFAFAVMRQQMKHKFGAQRLALTGADGQLVDAVLVPCHAQYEAYSRRQRDALRGEAGAYYVSKPPPATPRSTLRDTHCCMSLSLSRLHGADVDADASVSGLAAPAPAFLPSPLGCVLFCSPNAGMYELLAQANKECTWVGYYASLVRSLTGRRSG